jgi:hypothetical protein
MGHHAQLERPAQLAAFIESHAAGARRRAAASLSEAA